ncbi:MAG: hypothetical protein WBI53_04015, partial [Paludibacter sp.]
NRTNHFDQFPYYFDYSGYQIQFDHFFTDTFKQSAKALLTGNALIIAQHYMLQHGNGRVGNLGIKAA